MMYSQALQYLYSFFNLERVSQFSYRRELNLQRVKLLLEWFQYPERNFKSVLIAGTKGKGSTAFLLQSMLCANGIKTGLYTSPHLSDFRERIRIGNQLISERELARLVFKIKSVIESKRKEICKFEPITFFEVSTLLAFLFFADRKVDWAVLEVGMGGRLDATNAVCQSLSILTLIGFDHEEHLGHTISKIAGEKAAVLKPDIPFVSTKQKPDALLVIRKKAKQVKVPGIFLNQDFRCRIRSESMDGSRFDFKMKGLKISNLRVKLPGAFQVENAALALAGLMVLKEKFQLPVSESGIRKGLLGSGWPGRFEIVKRRGATYIIDGAHNQDSMLALVKGIQRLFRNQKIITIFGISREKNLKVLLPILARVSENMVVTKAAHVRAELPKFIVEAGKPYFHLMIPTDNIRTALSYAKKMELSNPIVLITGSLFLAGEAGKLLK